MQIKQPMHFAQGFGVAAGLFLALGAISLFFRPNPLGLGETIAQAPKPATSAGEVSEKTAPLPPDFPDICRAAGL